MAVPLNNENLTLKKIGDSAPLSPQGGPYGTHGKKSDCEAYNKFMQMYERLDSALAGRSYEEQREELDAENILERACEK